jgi:hypothetical protein
MCILFVGFYFYFFLFCLFCCSRSYIPHPMIVSQVWALLGFFKATHFRTEWPYVVPIHILLYLIHMMQEILDIYQKPKSLKLKLN